MKIIKNNIIYILLIAVHLILLLQLTFFPYPEMFVYSYLTENGLLPYKQITDQHFPGLLFLPVNFHSLGIDTIPEMRMVHLFLTTFSDAIFVVIIIKIFKKSRYVIIGLILYIFWQIYLEGHVLWIESFITPLILSAFGFLQMYFEKRSIWKLYLAAFLLGIALVFKQTVLPLMLLVYLYLLLKKVEFKQLFISGVISFTPILLVFIYFYKLGVMPDFFYWTVTFNLTIFSEMGKTRPDFYDIIKMLPVFGVSIFTLIYFLIRKKDNIVNLTGVFLFGCLFFAYARFDYIHLQPALPFSIILLTLLIITLSRVTYQVSSIIKKVSCIKYPVSSISFLIFCSLFTVYCSFSLYIFFPYFRFNHQPGLSPTLNDPDTKILVENINKYHKNDSKIFALGTYPHIYYLTNTLPAGDIFTFQFPWFMLVNEERVFQGIIGDPPQLVLRDQESQVGGYKLIDYMRKINGYINDNYQLVEKVNDVEILEKT